MTRPLVFSMLLHYRGALNVETVHAATTNDKSCTSHDMNIYIYIYIYSSMYIILLISQGKDYCHSPLGS